MDVIGRDDLPTDTKGSATKLTNGNVSLSEDNANTVAAATTGAGRKKTKRKSKAKNSHREDAESELKIDATLAKATAVEKLSAELVPLPKVATSMVEANGENVNSKCSTFGSSSSSSNHKGSHSNGLPADDDAFGATSVDAISKKLEECVQISRNGLTNGLPKHEDKSGHRSAQEEGSNKITTGDKEPSGKGSKKKHRSSQAKKAQTSNVDCKINGQEDIEVHEKVEHKSVEPSRNRQTQDVAHIGNLHDTCGVEGKTKPAESCSHAGNDPNGSSSQSVLDAPTSSIASPPASSDAAEVGETSGKNQPSDAPVQITYQVYESERQMPAIMSLIQKDLSEPYSIYTYRYFIHNWPKLCFLALHGDTCVGAIVCKLDIHRQDTRRGYIAMLAVDKDYRKLKIGTTLVQKAIQVMVEDNADEVVLETEITNQPALRLYENLGFVRDKRLFHYYLNGVDALRLKLWFR
ncbi:N-alpha-acetyltransferase 30A-like [Anopheles ziemanni]|uniref:N-alpha-acetyltransferase 30A-like n=1 Tax=Anopheles coustani TaxID=139045 RepID=UPI002658F22E|nr:N-alpha-acetyltransferase 30A-like [Anopheles coustani]XP_058169343.1 N-alpha-acetyltransferase 30A-like [Anopheles ziemanni]